MKKSDLRSGSILAALLLFSACRVVDPFVKVKLDIPAAPAFGLDAVKEITLVSFWREPDAKDFDLNETLLAFFDDLLKRSFRGKISISTLTWENAKAGENKEFWVKTAPGGPGRLILTGKAVFAQELRKALLGPGRRPIDDGPFAPEKTWAERLNYSLKLDLMFIRPESGDVAYAKTFQETLTYENQKQPAEYAAADLLDRVRLKLLRLVFGAERAQERYLLIR